MPRKSKLTLEEPKALIEVTFPDGTPMSVALPELQYVISLLDLLKTDLDTKAQTFMYKVTDNAPEISIAAKFEIEGVLGFWRQSLQYAVQDKNLSMDWRVQGFWREVDVRNIPVLRKALLDLSAKCGVIQVQVNWQ